MSQRIAVIGATGLVGRTLVETLQKKELLPYSALYLLASAASAEEGAMVAGLPVEDASTFDFTQADLVFMMVGEDEARLYVPQALDAGCTVIDNSAAYRMDPEVPLVIPEVNPEAIASHTPLVANPNCSTIQMLVALNPVRQHCGLSRITVSTYQSVSGAGQEGMHTLARETAEVLNGHGQPDPEGLFPQGIAFNVIPMIGVPDEEGHSTEETKMHQETQKIWNTTLGVDATSVRVPTFYGHGQAIFFETEQPTSLTELHSVFETAPGVVFWQEGTFPTPKEHAEQAGVHVARLRASHHNPQGFWIWVMANNVDKGAALNSLHIAELIAKQRGQISVH